MRTCIATTVALIALAGTAIAADKHETCPTGTIEVRDMSWSLAENRLMHDGTSCVPTNEFRVRVGDRFYSTEEAAEKATRAAIVGRISR